MHYPPIQKPPPSQFKVKPNITDYQALRKSFRWEDAEKELDWLPGGSLNLAYEAVPPGAVPLDTAPRA